jgi:branched-chain amino acid transport system substrate-binding protein
MIMMSKSKSGRPANIRSALAVVSVAAITLVSAGCSSSQPSGGSTGSDTVTLGAVISLTGAQSQYGVQAQDGIRLAVDYLNDHGGISGKKVNVDYRDDNGDRVQAIDQFRKLAADQKYVGIIGPQSTLAYTPTVEIAQQSKVVNFSAGALGAITWNPWTFRDVTTTTNAIPEYVGLFYKQAPFKSVAFMSDSTNDNDQLEVKLAKETLQGKGVKVLNEEVYQAGDRDFSGQITKILNNKPDTIFLAAQTNEAAAFIVQVRRQGFKGKIFAGSGLQDPNVLKLTNGVSAGVVTYTGFDTSGETNAIAKRLVTSYKQLKGGDNPSTYVAFGYDAVLILAKAMEKSDTITRASLQKNLSTLCDFKVATGAVCYKKGSGDNTTQPVFVGSWQTDGSFKVLTSTEK